VTRIILFAAALAISSTAFAHDVITTKVTWSREISREVFKHCASCHHDGGAAFSLMTYEEARPWALSIKEEVLSRRMPPWGAVKGFGSFQNDKGLTQGDLEIVSDWVVGGAPEGDPALLPKPPVFPTAVAPAKPSGTELVLDGTLTLQNEAKFTGVFPKSLPKAASVQVIAVHPDGTVQPIIWLYDFHPKFAHEYTFANPLELPAGTRIEMSPANVGSIALLNAAGAGPVISARTRAR